MRILCFSVQRLYLFFVIIFNLRLNFVKLLERWLTCEFIFHSVMSMFFCLFERTA